MKQSYDGKKILVFGLARSGLAAARLLLGQGAEVIGADESSKVAMPDDLGGMPVSLGPSDGSLLDGCAEIVLSPGIPAGHHLLDEASCRGIPVISELELGYRFAAAPIVAVTGTNGKSTTVSMIGALLKAGGYEVIVAGNVGVPFCSKVEGFGPDGVFVLEVSSFQLETISDFRPRVAGVLNMTPDHLDRYATLDDYYLAKKRIIENCQGDDTFVYNANDRRCSEMAVSFPGQSIPFSSRGPIDGGVYKDDSRMMRERAGSREHFMDAADLSVTGLHNIENALAAVAAVDPFDIPADACSRALSAFTGLPHRMEEVAEVAGVTYFNDSKATNVEATVMSLKGLEKPAVLIAGGYDKGSDYTLLRPVLGPVKRVIAIGAAAPLIEAAIGDEVPVERADGMKDAVERAGTAAGPGELVILSPACASFDMFDNFEHRGEVFKACVLALGEHV
jgi:UDP-N-acetylmuramoylalanine--D-glutamate ligase